MIFGRRKPAPLPQAAHMGFRSRLVLEKLGFDLRERYGEPATSNPVIGTAPAVRSANLKHGTKLCTSPMVRIADSARDALSFSEALDCAVLVRNRKALAEQRLTVYRRAESCTPSSVLETD